MCYTLSLSCCSTVSRTPTVCVAWEGPCSLVGVPVSLGSNRAPGSSFSSDFYVLDIASYHWLFGLPLLAAVEGEVLCKPRILRFRLGAEGKGELVALPLVPRSSLPT